MSSEFDLTRLARETAENTAQGFKESRPVFLKMDKDAHNAPPSNRMYVLTEASVRAEPDTVRTTAFITTFVPDYVFKATGGAVAESTARVEVERGVYKDTPAAGAYGSPYIKMTPSTFQGNYQSPEQRVAEQARAIYKANYA